MVLALALVNVIHIVVVAEHEPSWKCGLCFTGLMFGAALRHGGVIVVPKGINFLFFIELQGATIRI